MPRGSVRKRGKRWYYQFYENGKLIERVAGDTKEEAIKKLNEELNRQYKGYERPQEIKLKDYLNEWLEEYIKPNRAENTYYKYKNAIEKRINPIMGNVRLCDLKPFYIDKMIRELKKDKLSNTTIQKYYQTLNTALNRAERMQIIINNPCKYVEKPKRDKYKANILTIDELKLICASLDMKKFEDYIFKLALDITIETGIRRGELCGLTWDNINFKEKYISIEKSMKRVDKNYVIGKLKTEKSNRKIPISEELLQKLNKHKIKQHENKLLYGEYYINPEISRKNELIFRKENGDFIIPSRFLQRLKRICKKNGIEKNIRWHDLRHTNATILLGQNVNMKIIQERLGHSLMETTANIYSHVTEKMNMEATQKITSIIKELY